jgi:hypothetical protein
LLKVNKNERLNELMHQYQKARISLLSNAEIEELYGLPTFNKKDRDILVITNC